MREYDPPMSVLGRRQPLVRLAPVIMAVTAVSLAGCGGSHDSPKEGEKSFDAAAVNVSAGEELTMIDTFEEGLPLLRRPEARALIRQFQGQEEEHLNGLTKLLRGLGGKLEGEAAEVDLSGVKSERDFLLLAYRLTGAALTNYLETVPHLSTPAPQAVSASIAASEAQHLVALRRLLGAGLTASVPEAFDTGEVPPPGGEGPTAAETPPASG
jgi:rubrerythrin